MKPSFFRSIFIYILFSAIAITQLEAAQLHVLLVGDTLDETLRKSLKKDLSNMKNEVVTIAKETNLNLNLKMLQGSAATPENILNHLMGMAITPADVVIVYYTGHGYRAASKDNVWPTLYYTSSDSGIDFDLTNQIVLSKKPRLFLSIADCCNNVIPDMWAPNEHQMSVLTKGKNTQAYKKLFLNSTGFIIISSCIVGQYSIAYDQKGGLYTSQFIKSLRRELKSPEANWYSLVADAYLKVIDQTEGTNSIQVPQHWMVVQ